MQHCARLCALLWLITGPADAQTTDLQQHADEAYRAQQWTAAVAAYQRLTDEQPDNHQYWFRLAAAHNGAGHGEAALAALDQMPEGGPIPAPWRLYQRARAQAVAGQLHAAWQTLEEAIQAGFTGVTNLQQDSPWPTHQNVAQYRAALTGVQRNAAPCEHDARFRAFDFWLGHWAVHGDRERTGPLQGHNRIEKTENGCLIMEHWQGAGGGTGTSMNYYDDTLDAWVQHWVSASGGTINMRGGLVDGSMVLVGKIHYLRNVPNPLRDFRGTWTPQSNGSVRQFFEESIDGGVTWYPWFEGFYFRQEP